MNRIIQLIKIYLLFILIFLLQKPLFMLYYHNLYHDVSFIDFFRVLANGLKLDASMAGYLTILPGIFLIASVWAPFTIIEKIFKGYFALMALLISIIFVADIALYGYWGFRLDSTALFYMKWPKDAMASVNVFTVIIGGIVIAGLTVLLYYVFTRFVLRKKPCDKRAENRLLTAFPLLLLTAALFIPIRGGFEVSTMNTGKVYFSSRIDLNHAAVNPMFSFMESLFKEQNFDKQYRFMSDEEAREEFKKLVEQPTDKPIPVLFDTPRPNIVMFFLESFGSKVVEPLGGIPGIATRLNRYCEEGILFTHFYANSFRTDRGLVSILSGYPAQPTTSIMKYPRKSQTLPSITKTLKQNGYSSTYYYGGDADFTNMRSYLVSQGISDLVTEQDFPAKDRTTKWGVHDHIVFQRLLSDLQNEQQEPFIKIMQTLSSHEPFDVPFHKSDDLYLNSVQYTDSCLGEFIEGFKKTKYWANSIVVLVPDHAMHYPSSIDIRSVERYRIPFLILGGAVKAPEKIDVYASQIDIAATLLHQFQLPHEEFTFSKNILNPDSPHFAFYTFPNGFGFLTSENHYVYDCDSHAVVVNEGNEFENRKKGEAYLQILYDDLAGR
jgi:phosphoglycerol transferase MdoB-like AlkP superfamily enzyme